MVVNYEHNLRFVTVHGSGHMVLTASICFALIGTLLSGGSFAELIPTDDQLAAFTDDEFTGLTNGQLRLSKELKK